jgi:hypothetical protein
MEPPAPPHRLTRNARPSPPEGYDPDDPGPWWPPWPPSARCWPNWAGGETRGQLRRLAALGPLALPVVVAALITALGAVVVAIVALVGTRVEARDARSRLVKDVDLMLKLDDGSRADAS